MSYLASGIIIMWLNGVQQTTNLLLEADRTFELGVLILLKRASPPFQLGARTADSKKAKNRSDVAPLTYQVDRGIRYQAQGPCSSVSSYFSA